MTNYNAPLDDINFLINEVFDLEQHLNLESFSDLTPEVVASVLNEAGKFASEKLAPLNHEGDKNGCIVKGGEIHTPEGFKDAYQEFVGNGWNSVPFSIKHGGQGLPWLVSTAISEMWSSANMAFALCPLLTQGAVELLSSHGSDEQKEKYLKKLVLGEWTGTMCLTESQAGSDVGAVSTVAKKNGDHYLITGQKIFITFGDHDFTENIIHMVLARTSNAPKGSKGLSLFIVPKVLDDGSRNDIRAISIEHKLGIHASPTCVLAFGDNGGATGYLVGEENMGLKYMFTMMNNARLAVGVEGIAVAEDSFQKALSFANERQQNGKAIIEFPDVKRMLLSISANTEAMRALSYYIAKSIDLAVHATDKVIKKQYTDIVNLLIPVLKSHATDMGVYMSSMALQVFGGVGYVEETGIAQNLRDARIAPIYEGTNGIQAMDLVMRKIMQEGAFAALAFDVQALCLGGKYNDEMRDAFGKLEGATKYMQKLVQQSPDKASFIASYYLRMFAIVMGGAMMVACDKVLINNESEFVKNKKETVDFYMNYIMPEIDYLARVLV